jgi:hypothetical protein
MTAGSVALPDAAGLEAISDPATRIITSCEQAKTWLAQALDGKQIEQIIELKSQAEAIRVYTMQRQLGKDAGLSASEIVRRAERCIGLTIRKGQAEGRIAKRGSLGGGRKADARADGTCSTVADATGMARSAVSFGPYALADGVSDEQFEKAIEEAKAEQNLSRAHVKAKLQKGNGKATVRWAKLGALAAAGHTSRQIAETLGVLPGTVTKKAKALGIVIQADRVLGRSRVVKPDQAFKGFISTLESLSPSCELIDVSIVSRDVIAECLPVFEDSMKALGSLQRRLRRATK